MGPIEPHELHLKTTVERFAVIYAHYCFSLYEWTLFLSSDPPIPVLLSISLLPTTPKNYLFKPYLFI